MEELGTGISLLDPAAPDQGRKDQGGKIEGGKNQGIKMRKFGLKINVDPTRIKMTILHGKIS